MDREKRAERLRLAIEEVRAGKQLSRVARRYKISVSYLHAMCRAHGVMTHSPPWASKTLEILALLFDAGLTYDVIAERLGVSKSRVGQVYQESVRMGVPLPQRSVGRPVATSAAQT